MKFEMLWFMIGIVHHFNCLFQSVGRRKVMDKKVRENASVVSLTIESRYLTEEEKKINSQNT